MYLQYWGLHESPFAGIDSRFFHQGSVHEEALARLHFLVDGRKRVGLLLGDSGLGKSMLLDVFGRQLRAAGHYVASIGLLGMGADEFYWHLAGQLGLRPPRGAAPFQLWRAVTNFIAANRLQRLSTVFLLDDADEASRDVLDQVVRLAQADWSADARITIVLTAHGRTAARLPNRLSQLAELRIDLEPWDATETKRYIDGALAWAGRRIPVFQEPALRRLYELSGGVPREIKQLADLALLAGAGCELLEIDPGTLEAVYHELGIATARSA